MGDTTIRDLPNLDLVRSIAVISVVVEHTLLSLGIQKIGPFPVAYLGVMGVMVFFVHTTLVLM
jgi:peptidoglycan/LPS O-acetylase OafA/YrhL